METLTLHFLVLHKQKSQKPNLRKKGPHLSSRNILFIYFYVYIYLYYFCLTISETVTWLSM